MAVAKYTKKVGMVQVPMLCFANSLTKCLNKVILRHGRTMTIISLSNLYLLACM